jgi:hypothetical protein
VKKLFDLRLLIILIAAVLYTVSSSAQVTDSIDDEPHNISDYNSSEVISSLN